MAASGIIRLLPFALKQAVMTGVDLVGAESPKHVIHLVSPISVVDGGSCVDKSSPLKVRPIHVRTYGCSLTYISRRLPVPHLQHRHSTFQVKIWSRKFFTLKRPTRIDRNRLMGPVSARMLVRNAEQGLFCK